eukprot:165822-Lingulodinium_polyedra.AAC.1
MPTLPMLIAHAHAHAHAHGHLNAKEAAAAAAGVPVSSASGPWRCGQGLAAQCQGPSRRDTAP